MQTDNRPKMGLGRGLGALLQPSTTTSQQPPFAPTDSRGGVPSTENASLLTIDITRIHPNVEQPRSVFNEDALDDLAQSIRENGILQPLVVLERGGGEYELLAGERRWRAAQRAGLTKVPAIVRETLPLRDKLILALIENIQREDLYGTEEARAYARLADEYGLSHEEIALRVGKSRSAVSNALRLLELDGDMIGALEMGKISKSHARALLAEPVPTLRRALFTKMLHGEGISVREAEGQVRGKSGSTRGVKDPNILALESALREALGTKVILEHRGGAGKIIIRYYAKEDLRRIVEKVTGKGQGQEDET